MCLPPQPGSHLTLGVPGLRPWRLSVPDPPMPPLREGKRAGGRAGCRLLSRGWGVV